MRYCQKFSSNFADKNHWGPKRWYGNIKVIYLWVDPILAAKRLVVETRARKITVEWVAFRGRKVVLARRRAQREASVLVLTSKLYVVEFLAGVLSTFNKSRDSLMPPTTRSSFWQSRIPRENELRERMNAGKKRILNRFRRRVKQCMNPRVKIARLVNVH